jgi:hypothetical protein
MLARVTSSDDPRQLKIVESLRRNQEAADAFDAAATNPNTRRSYLSDWRSFDAYCERHGFASLPASPEHVRLYISWLAIDDAGDSNAVPPRRPRRALKRATIARRLVTIRIVHELFGYDSPTDHPIVKNNWKGIRKRPGQARAKKAPVLVEQPARSTIPSRGLTTTPFRT